MLKNWGRKLAFLPARTKEVESFLKKEGCVSGEKQDLMYICSVKTNQVEDLSLPTLITF